jgi:hypothetical protein
MIVLKNALNAILTNAALIGLMHDTFNTYSTAGLLNIGKATLSVIGAREAIVWVPVLLKWSSTNADPNKVVLTKIPPLK